MELLREGVDLIDFEGIVCHSTPVEIHVHHTSKTDRFQKNVLQEVKVHACTEQYKLYIRLRTP